MNKKRVIRQVVALTSLELYFRHILKIDEYALLIKTRQAQISDKLEASFADN